MTGKRTQSFTCAVHCRDRLVNIIFINIIFGIIIIINIIIIVLLFFVVVLLRAVAIVFQVLSGRRAHSVWVHHRLVGNTIMVEMSGMDQTLRIAMLFDFSVFIITLSYLDTGLHLSEFFLLFPFSLLPEAFADGHADTQRATNRT